MSTAVIYSGQARTFLRCFPTHRWHVFRHFTDLRFYVSVEDDERAGDMDVLREHYEHVHIERVKTPADLPEIPIERGNAAPYANAASHRQLMAQHWANQRAWEFYQSFAPVGNVVLRMRCDQFFHSFARPTGHDVQDVDLTTEPEWRAVRSREALTPWWGRFGGVNDRFAVLGFSAAEHYFTTFSKIPRLLDAGCPFHPESLVKASLLDGGVDLRETLLAEFSTERMNGERRWWINETLPCDWAHLAINR